MRKSSIKIWASLFACLFVIGAADRARAGIAVSPLKQEITVRPGDTEKHTITIANNARGAGDVTQSVHLAIADVQVGEDGGITFKDAGAAQHSASKWVTLGETDLTLEPNQSKAVEFTVAAPQSAMAGEYYSAIMVTLGTKARDEKGVLIQYRTASGIFLTIPGRTFPRQAKITRCEMLWPPAPVEGAQAPVEPPQPKISLTLDNYGQARFDVAAKLALFDEKSRLVFAGPLNTKRPCVFGGDSRIFETPITKALPAGKYVARMTLDYQSWAPLRQTLPIEILPEQAVILATLKKHQPNEAIGLEVTPDKPAYSIPAGGSRTFALTAKNVVDLPVHCAVALFQSEGASADSFITLSTPDFIISKGSRKSIPVSIHISAGAKPGKYTSHITFEGAPGDLDPSTLLVPVEIEVQAER
jgi:hypothetical protein